MTLGAVKQAIGLLGILFLISALIAVFIGLGHIFDGRIFTGLARMAVSLVLLGSVYMIIRLLAEILSALHRLNDRMSILGDDLRRQRTGTTSSFVADAKA